MMGEVVVFNFETSAVLVSPIQLPESYPWVTLQEEDPPGPISNPAVKLLLAYGSMGETPCESRFRPGFYFYFVWPHRTTASPSDSQSEDRGSIPRGAAKRYNSG